MPRVFVTRELPGERFAALRNDPDLELDIWPGDFPPGATTCSNMFAASTAWSA